MRACWVATSVVPVTKGRARCPSGPCDDSSQQSRHRRVVRGRRDGRPRIRLDARLGDGIRFGRQRRERVLWTGRDGADQRRGRCRAGGARVRRRIRPGAGVGRPPCPLPADRVRGRVPLQEGGDHFGSDGRVPGRDRRVVGDGRRRAHRGERRVTESGADGRRDRDGASPRLDVRPGGGTRADPVHRAQHDGRHQGHHGVAARARQRPGQCQGVARRRHSHDVGHGTGHERQVQGNRPTAASPCTSR